MYDLSDVHSLSYAEFVSLVDERNRPSGGLRSVSTALVNAHLPSSSRILEIGSNTGFTSVHLSHLCDGSVTGVDVEASSVEKATAYAAEHGVSDRVRFQVANVGSLPFPDEHFDMVWLSNVTSFVQDKETALQECVRVLKPGGRLVFIPIYYRLEPSPELLSEVERLLACPLRIWSKDAWIEFVTSRCPELFVSFENDYRYTDQATHIPQYVEVLLAKPHLAHLNADEKSNLRRTANHIYTTFNRNLQLCGYSIFVLLKLRTKEEPELFLTEAV